VEALMDAGLVMRTRNAGRVRWGLTDAGAVRVAQARLDGEADLPDSPQRREWQRGRSEAEEQIESIRKRLGDELRDGLGLLDSETGDAATWYGVVERLARECRRLGGATFCLHEWDCPDDEDPDLEYDSAANRRVREALSGLFPVGVVKGDLAHE